MSLHIILHWCGIIIHFILLLISQRCLNSTNKELSYDADSYSTFLLSVFWKSQTRAGQVNLSSYRLPTSRALNRSHTTIYLEDVKKGANISILNKRLYLWSIHLFNLDCRYYGAIDKYFWHGIYICCSCSPGKNFILHSHLKILFYSNNILLHFLINIIHIHCTLFYFVSSRRLSKASLAL